MERAGLLLMIKQTTALLLVAEKSRLLIGDALQ